MPYKQENHNIYKVSEGCVDYDKWSGYDKPDSHIHTLGHLMGAGLTNPKSFMDFDKAAKKLPMGKKQISGYESEPIAVLYSMFLDYYPNKFPVLLYGVAKNESVFDHKDIFLSYLKNKIEISNSLVFYDFKKKLTAVK